ILSVNVVVFCMWQNLSWRRFMAKNFAISTAAVTQEGRFHTIITSFFSHYDWVHLGANMCCLWFFGAETLRILGGRKFLALYVGGGLVSSIFQVLWPRIAPEKVRYSPYQLGLGARQESCNGAVNAVVAYNILTYPSRIILIYAIFPVPAAALGLMFL
ncbi:hypothetical protein GUITHDRAFT_52711, partial [Guillardia theta CCMP2712]